ncbi:ATP-binding protein [Notoacmeibacter sp. MSK16QG-6]|uniref:ATP-binding protein n=1 Tax=Notoacmeibacter sp. MSK16QG-6 TaxID=2957982 RepID=UPI00209E721E|nr:ATP-binding protein [Notoacmeibacter sp. MSK16QG-6]MCP1198579.1 ATP-binding protein [Notoacmeibacter sp. MSK16QG-6]
MISLPVEDESQIGAVRRASLAAAKSVELTDDDMDRLAIIVTEACTNLIRHAKNGEVLIGAETGGKGGCVTIVALDGGPGITNVEAAMVDGFTTADSKPRGIGGGLGSMQRMADSFDIHSGPHGTTLVAKIGHRRQASSFYDVAGLIVPKPGYEMGGDAFNLRVGKTTTTVMLMDVLGHGPKAAQDAATGVEAFAKTKTATLEETEQAIAHALAGGRGAAALLVEIPHEPGVLRCVGVGNIKGDIFHADGRRNGIPSQPGILGATSRHPRVTEHEWTSESVLLLATDGLKTISAQPEPTSLFFRSAEMIASTIYKLKRRGTDDSGVLVVRSRP